MVACQHQMYLAEYLDQLECVLFTRYCVANFKGPKFCWLCSNEIPTQNHTLLTKFDDVYRKLRKIDRFLSLSLSLTANPNTTLYCGTSFVKERLRV